MAWGLHRSSAARPQSAGAALRAWLGAAVAAPAAVPAGHYTQALSALTTRPDDALAVEVALPFCASHCLCCERQVHVAQPAAVLDAYVADLVAEMAHAAAHLGGPRDVLRLHLGGGTANELSDAQLSQLVEGVARHGRLPGEALLSADCDPRRTGWLQLHTLRGLGFRELAFGVLDLEPEVQEAIGRTQSARLMEDVCDMAREAGIGSIDLRLMVGLPRQTPQTWQATLRRVIALAPDRVSIGRYHHQPALVQGQRDINAAELPSPAASSALMAQAGSVLDEAGYRWLGADLFVLESDDLALAADEGRLRFGLGGYSALPPLPQVGLGAGAMGEIDGQLFWNQGALPLWHQAVRAGQASVTHGAVLDDAARRRRDAVEQLLCRQRVERAADDTALDAAWQRLAPLAEQGLVNLSAHEVVVTEAGRAALTSLCEAFATGAA